MPPVGVLSGGHGRLGVLSGGRGRLGVLARGRGRLGVLARGPARDAKAPHFAPSNLCFQNL